MDSHLVTHKKLQEQSTKSLIKCIQSIFGSKNYNIINCNKIILEISIKNYLKDYKSFLFTSFNFNFIIINS